ncbi:DUF6702 family protein [Caulobacter sp. X]|uniref:DUF6702 family protein n=1 Tax=Caulobacter sp. X TaxID=2048901 RepID=UPI000C147996|nr:DUF6702 family protein [Caulobacter sp. X]PIC00716.1 hypothetical protein CSW60_03920 [Caulobacter sp. X]
MIRRAVVLMAAAGLLLAPLPAAAHRGHGALSVVELDAKTGAVTVSHRVPAHDAEPALAAIAPDAQTSLDDPEAVEALKRYMASRFSVSISGQPVALTLKDMTLGADEVRFEYAGMTSPADIAGAVTVRAPLFADIYGDQVNQVNIRRLGVTRTLIFNASDAADPQTVDAIVP